MVAVLTVGVTVAAGLGALCRYLIGLRVRAPYGTLLINVSGSFLLGVLVGQAGEDLLAIAGIGFAGGFTTLSTWAWETVVLAEQGDRWAALANTGISFGAGLLAAGAGLALVS